MLATVGMISAFRRNSGPSTPATVNWFLSAPLPVATPLRVMLLPTIAGSAAKTRCQKPWLRITTGALPGTSSSGRSSRPWSGLAPSRLNRLDDVSSSSTRSGCSRPSSVALRPWEIDISWNDRFSVRTSMYWPGDGQSSGMLIPGDRSHSTASRSGLGYGKGFSRTPLTTLKIAVLAPIPMASDAMMMKVETGLRRSMRRA